MPEDSSILCSHCGSSDSVGVRYAACVATSSWARNNYPAPNDYLTTYDDIRLWRIGLCETCIPSGYRSYLQHRLKKLATQFGLYSLMLFIGVLGLLAVANKIIVPKDAPLPIFGWFISALITIALAVGALGVPICAVMWIVAYIRLKGLERSGVVPARRVAESFKGEGQRIIEALAHKRGMDPEKVWGEFVLPVHKTKDQLDLSPQAKEKLGFTTPKRDIEAVGKTIQEVEKQLPPQWKPLWEKSKVINPPA